MIDLLASGAKYGVRCNAYENSRPSGTEDGLCNDSVTDFRLRSAIRQFRHVADVPKHSSEPNRKHHPSRNPQHVLQGLQRLPLRIGPTVPPSSKQGGLRRMDQPIIQYLQPIGTQRVPG